MKTLYIVRHGKSSWDDSNVSDHDRPLKKKGEKRTLKIAGFLKSRNIKPDLMVSSSAVRAYETAVIIADHLNYPPKNILKEPTFYHAEESNLLNYLSSVDNGINSIMLFGHNPGFTSFANKFLADPIEWLPTSAIVSINFASSNWEEIVLAKRETNFVIYPKML